MVVVATAGAHEHGATSHAVDDLEAEEATVELGGCHRVADVQHGVVELGDGDHGSGSAARVVGAEDLTDRRTAHDPG